MHARLFFFFLVGRFHLSSLLFALLLGMPVRCFLLLYTDIFIRFLDRFLDHFIVGLALFIGGVTG